MLTLILDQGQAQENAQESLGGDEKISVTSAYLNNIYGEKWRGIVFYCHPYCEFMTVKETNIWKPEPDQRQIKKNELKFIEQNDPLYPLLVAKLPILPFIQQNEKASKDLKSKNSTEKKIPPFAKSPFDFLWSVQIGPEIILNSIKSDTQVQSGLASTAAFPNYGVNITLAKGKPFQLFQQWLQVQFQIYQSGNLGYSMADSDLKMNRQNQTLDLTFWSMKKKYKWGVGYVQRSIKYLPSMSSLPHYQTSQTDNILKLSFLFWKRWQFDFETIFSSQINDSQNFRTQPLKVSGFGVNANYCSKDYVSFDLHYGFCSGLYWRSQSQKSNLNESYFEEKTSSIVMTDLGGKIFLRFGGDFFQ